VNLTQREQKELIALDKRISLLKARSNLWEFCKLLAPDFYIESRTHLKDLCYILQYLYEGSPQEDGIEYKKVMINMPPQFGKTRTMSMWCMWVLGQSPEERFTLASYGDDPAHDMSRNIRNGIAEEKNIQSDIVFSDIFPNTKLKYGDSGVKRWALEGQHFNFLAAGIIGGAVTSKSATIQIFDDPIKGREEALNESHKEKVWGSKVSTWGSRKDSKVQEVLEVMIATRWAKDDPCGKELELSRDEWFIYNMPAYNEATGEMLCSDFLNYESYQKKLIRSQENPVEEQIFLANYQQETIDRKGLLYNPFKTYNNNPEGIKMNQTDTADTGEDYLCSINYILDRQGYCYVTDILYTQDSMEYTEPATAKMIMNQDISITWVESNNGGRGFARKIEELVLRSNKINWYTQKRNKAVKIFNNSATVNDMILFPEGWNVKWPLFYKHLTQYKIKFKANKHDDIPDTLTEMILKSKQSGFKVTVRK